MRNLLLVSVIIALSGCASLPEQKPIDPKCDQVGKYARSIATLRDIGVAFTDINAFTAEPVVVAFPFQRIKQEAYFTKMDNPAETYSRFYNQCTTVGYDHLLNDLKKIEEKRINDLKPKTKPVSQQKRRKIIKRKHKHVITTKIPTTVGIAR